MKKEEEDLPYGLGAVRSEVKLEDGEKDGDDA